MKRNIFVIALLSIFICGCEENIDSSLLKNNNAAYNEEDIIIDGIVRVKLSPEIGDSFIAVKSNTITKSGNDDIDSYMQEIGAKSMERVFPYHPLYEKRARKHGLHLWYDIEFDNSRPTTKVAKDLENIRGILKVEKICKIVEPVSYYVITEPPTTKANEDMPWNDPYLEYQWHYNNTGNQVSNATLGADINLFEAWKEETGKSDVIVAIVDGGIDFNHPDLAGSMWINEKEKLGAKGTDDDDNRYVDDIHGYNFVGNGDGTITAHSHGTHVAGTVAARNNNYTGVCGVAGGNGDENSGVRLMSCQIFEDKRSATNKRIGEAIMYAANNGALICQNSWQFPENYKLPDDIKDAIDYFIANAGCDADGNQKSGSRMKGGIVIFAAGNGQPPTESKIYPSAYEPVVAVASMAPNFLIANYYSNRGTWVDIMAPGGETYPNKDRGVYSTFPKGMYAYDQGTSMACPHVSGIAALIVSKYGKEGYTCQELKDHLLKAISPYNVYEYNPTLINKLGAGYIDAVAALRENKKINPDPVTSANLSKNGNNIMITWNAVSDKDDGYAFKYILYYSKNELTESNYRGADSIQIISNRIKAGTPISANVETDLSQKYSFAIIAQDRWGLQSKPFFFKESLNYAPQLSVIGKNDFKITGKEIVTVRIKVTDPENHSWTHRLEGYTECVKVSQKDDIIALVFSANGTKGKHEVKLIVTDELGESSSEVITFEILDQNANPIAINKKNDIKIFLNTETKIKLSEYFKDDDGDILTYTITSNDNSIANITIDGEFLCINAFKEGKSFITVTAKDPSGAEATSTFNIIAFAINSNQIAFVYPSKVQKDINICVNTKDAKCNICILTPSGKVIHKNDYSLDSTKTIVLNLSKLSGGSYVILVKTIEGTHKQLFVKL